MEDVDKKICPVCGSQIRLYVPCGEPYRKNAQCPVCRALERHRFMWLYFKHSTNIFSGAKLSVLHFAPEQAFYNYFSAIDNIDYYPVDANLNYKLKLRTTADIQNTAFEDCKFDVIICNHVLEHIPDDCKAISELYRVLKPGGSAYIAVPLSDSDTTFEDPSHNTPELRLRHYGQDDHVRIYGRDIVKKLSPFSNVDTVTPKDIFSDDEIEYYSLSMNSAIFVCAK